MGRSFHTQLEDFRQAGANVRILAADEVERWQTVAKYREVQAAWAGEQ
jgi:hypothetical protein